MNNQIDVNKAIQKVSARLIGNWHEPEIKKYLNIDVYTFVKCIADYFFKEHNPQMFDGTDDYDRLYWACNYYLYYQAFMHALLAKLIKSDSSSTQTRKNYYYGQNDDDKIFNFLHPTKKYDWIEISYASLPNCEVYICMIGENPDCKANSFFDVNFFTWYYHEDKSLAKMDLDIISSKASGRKVLKTVKAIDVWDEINQIYKYMM